MKSRVNEVVEFFTNGKDYNCAQAVFSSYCGDYGLDRETALKLSCGLGAGMSRLGQTCGAVSGACLVIGLKHGRFLPEDMESNENTYALVQEFAKRFIERNKTLNCNEILQLDLRYADKQLVNERFHKICPCIVKDAAEILESILFE